MSLLPSVVAGGGELPADYYFVLKNDPALTQTLDLSGNILSISGGNSVNIADATTVSTSAVKLTAQSYIEGFNSTQFSGEIIAAGNIQSASELGGSAVLNGLNSEVAIGGSLAQPPHVRFELPPSADAFFGYNGEQFYMHPVPEYIKPHTLYFDPGTSTITYGLATGGAVGPTGPQGVQGIQGVPGPDGPTGPQGIQGNQGVPGDVGPTGPAGAAGAEGPTGPQGVAGPVGAEGPTGPQGVQGIQGPQGIQGIDGPTGPAGAAGAEGPTGPQGAAGPVGAAGPTGPEGPQGVQGIQGPQGIQGIDGPTGPQGPVGAEGPTGPQGLQGMMGPDGATGPQGPQGIQGIQGPAGPQGADGPTGPQGPAGADGASSSFYNYTADTGSQAPPVTNGHLEWNNATQTAATELYVSHLTNLGDDIDVFLALLKTGDALILQDQNNSANNQKWEISATPTVLENQYTTIPVTLTSSTHSFNNNDQILFVVVATGAVGPTGPQGPQGPQGIAGPTGPQGIQGPAGAQGIQGPAGADGPTGPAGAQGPEGPTGPQGVQGIQGPEGPTGPQGIQGPAGAQGIQGPEGPTGPQGAVGPEGPTGPQGAQGIQGPEGPTGPQGVQGIQGAVGPEGPTGPAGAVGAQGATGPQGPQGELGPTGPQGIQGVQGIQGIEGPTGPQGVQGIQGAQGPQGELGPTGPTGPAGGLDQQVLFNNGVGATGSAALLFDYTAKVLTMADVAGSIVLNPGNESLNVSNTAGADAQMGAGSLALGDGAGKSITLLSDTMLIQADNGVGSTYTLDCSTEPPSVAMVGTGGSSLQTPYGVGFTYGTNQATIDTVMPKIEIIDATGAATRLVPLAVEAVSGTASASLSAAVLDLTDGSNNVNLSSVTPSFGMTDGTNTSAILAGTMTVSLPPTAADQLTRKDYVDGVAGFSPANMFYVAANGSDVDGNGSFLKPWQTIQHSINQIEAIPPTAATQAVLNVAPGHYTENLTFTTGYIALVSPFNSNDNNEFCELTGDVLINITTGADDLFNKQVMFQGIQFTGEIRDTSSRQHTVLIQDCYLFANVRAFYQNSSVNCRSRIYNCEISGTSTIAGGAVVEIAAGDAYCERLDITGRAASTGNVFVVSGTGAAFCTNCNFTSSTTSTASPGVKVVYVTSTRGSTFGQCNFVFDSFNAKTNGNGFWLLRYEPPTSAATNAISIAYCAFSPAGMNSANFVAGSNGSSTTPVFVAPILFGNCVATPASFPGYGATGIFPSAPSVNNKIALATVS